jgi:hypothetical protein
MSEAAASIGVRELHHQQQHTTPLMQTAMRTTAITMTAQPGRAFDALCSEYESTLHVAESRLSANGSTPFNAQFKFHTQFDTTERPALSAVCVTTSPWSFSHDTLQLQLELLQPQSTLNSQGLLTCSAEGTKEVPHHALQPLFKHPSRTCSIPSFTLTSHHAETIDAINPQRTMTTAIARRIFFSVRRKQSKCRTRMHLWRWIHYMKVKQNGVVAHACCSRKQLAFTRSKRRSTRSDTTGCRTSYLGEDNCVSSIQRGS